MARHANPVVRPLVKFVIYAGVCMLLLFSLANRVGNLQPPWHHRAMYTAILSDAESLVAKNDVKIAGVTVGQVHSVKVRRDKAVVRFSLDRSLRLRQGTAAGLRWQDIIGHKYLYLYPSPDGAVLPRGATLTDEVRSADVGDFLMDVGGFLRALNPRDINTFTAAIVSSLQDNQAQVSQLLGSSADLADTLGSQDTAIGRIVDNLTSTMTAIESRDADLAQVIDRLSSVASDVAARNDVIDNVIANLTQANGDLTQLVDANATNVAQITANLQAVTDVLQHHTAQLGAGLTTGSAGLAAYIQISKLGQWFAIRVVYSCLAQQRSCSYDQPTNQPTSLDNKPYNPVPGSQAGSLPAPGVEPTSGPVAPAARPAPRAAGLRSPDGTSAPAGLAALTDPGAAPIGPPVPPPTLADVWGFAVYGDGSQ